MVLEVRCEIPLRDSCIKWTHECPGEGSNGAQTPPALVFGPRVDFRGDSIGKLTCISKD